MIVLWMAAHPWSVLAVLVVACVVCAWFGLELGRMVERRRRWAAAWDEDLAADEPLSPPPLSHPVWRNPKLGGRLSPSDQPLDSPPALKSSGPAMVPGETPGRLLLGHETAGPEADQWNPGDFGPDDTQSERISPGLPGPRESGCAAAGPEPPWLPAEPGGPMEAEWDRLGLPLDAPPTVVHPTAVLSPLPHPDSPAAERLAGPETLARGFMSVHNRAFELAVPEGWRR